MRLAALVRRALSTRNRRAGIVLLLIAGSWELTDFLIVGHAERWRVWAAWSAIIAAPVLGLFVLIAGPHLSAGPASPQRQN